MSIKHLEDLTYNEFRTILETEWHVSEKIDGSFFIFGKDEYGFYATKKGFQKLRKVSDWPDTCWSSDFKQAHEVAHDFYLEYIKDKINDNFQIEAEIVGSSRHNTIVYTLEENTKYLVITNSSIDCLHVDNGKAGGTYRYPLLNFNSIMEETYSPDGIDIQKAYKETQWSIIFPSQIISVFSRVYIGGVLKNYISLFESYFNNYSGILDLTYKQVYNTKLNKRPDYIEKGNWTPEVRARIKEERELVNNDFLELKLMFKRKVTKSLSQYMKTTFMPVSMIEGYVVRAGNVVFKITNKEGFTKANMYTHFLKYMLVGDPVKKKHSFLSRTKHWSQEDRLSRLEVLRQRFLKHHKKLKKNFENVSANSHVTPGSTIISYSSPDMFQRALNLFAEVRKRIIDGW